MESGVSADCSCSSLGEIAEPTSELNDAMTPGKFDSILSDVEPEACGMC